MRVDSYFTETFGYQSSAPGEIETQPLNFNCLRYLVNEHDKVCGAFEDYSLKYVKHLVHVCETGTDQDVTDVITRF